MTINLPPNLAEKVDTVSEERPFRSVTHYIETLVREDLARRGIAVEEKPAEYETSKKFNPLGKVTVPQKVSPEASSQAERREKRA